MKGDPHFAACCGYTALTDGYRYSPFEDYVKDWPATEPCLNPFPFPPGAPRPSVSPPSPPNSIVTPLPWRLPTQYLLNTPFNLPPIRAPYYRYIPIHHFCRPDPHDLYEYRGDTSEPFFVNNIPVTSHWRDDIVIDLEEEGGELPFCAYCAQSPDYPSLHPTLTCPRLRSALQYIVSPDWREDLGPEKPRPIAVFDVPFSASYCFYCQAYRCFFVTGRQCSLNHHRFHSYRGCPAHPYARLILLEKGRENYRGEREWFRDLSLPGKTIVHLCRAHYNLYDYHSEIVKRTPFQ